MKPFSMAKWTLIIVTIAIQPLRAQAPSANTWSGNFGAGLAITSGNTDTENVNISLGLVRDPKKRTVTRFNGLYLRGAQNKQIILNRTAITAREELNVTPVIFAFGQTDYLHDTFKRINYFLSPTAGIGVKVLNTDTTLLEFDTGVGGIWERDIAPPTSFSGAYNAGQRLGWKLSKTANLTESIVSIWKTNNWADSLHNFNIALGVSVSSHLELKAEFLDSFKNRPALRTLKKNDTSTVTALVVKF